MITYKAQITSGDVGSVDDLLVVAEEVKAAMKAKESYTFNGVTFIPKQATLHGYLNSAFIQIEGYIE